jgi:hypothetical protein
MFLQRKALLVYVLLLLTAFSFRFYLANFLPNNEPNDGKVYAQIARNILEQRVYSHATEPPYEPSLIRLPGYPLFLASIYSVGGHFNNRAVRVVQAVTDTLACGVVGFIAYIWEADPKRKRLAGSFALALAALCPFTAIYVATILTETPTIFLAVTMLLSASFAFQAKSWRRSVVLWLTTGVIGSLAVLFRPDSGLFVASIGLTLVGATASRIYKHRALGLERAMHRVVPQGGGLVLVFALGFSLVLVPWTIRNYRVFHVFQPLAPAHAEMPGEFVPRGYLKWVRTWIEDQRDVGPALWSLDEHAIKLSDFPQQAFASRAEQETVAALLDKYNHPVDSQESETTAESQTDENTNSDQPGDEAESSSATEEEEGNEADDQNTDAGEQNVEMTPEIDAGFELLARSRIANRPLRYYVVLPLKRALNLWFDTHSQYYPFDGELFPLSDLDHDLNQQFWLPLFCILTGLYTFLGILGGWALWISRSAAARRWLLLAALLMLTRVVFFSTLENPEPRYVVEIFPFISILGGIALGRIPFLAV